MNREEFERLLQESVGREQSLLTAKRSEYAEDEDILENFRWVALAEGRSPEEYCMTLFLKHVQGLVKAIQTGRYFWGWVNLEDGQEGLKQRISDGRNYLMLLEAILEERHKLPPEAGKVYDEAEHDEDIAPK